jgi:histone H3/H4
MNNPTGQNQRYVSQPIGQQYRPVMSGRIIRSSVPGTVVRTTMGPRPPHRRSEFPGGVHTGSGSSEVSELISRQKLSLLAKDIDSCTVLEDDVINLLLKLSEDFIDTVVQGSCSLAKHRKSQTLDVADVKLCLSQQWDLQIPGFPVDENKHKKQQTGEAHKQRLALIKKQLKR